MLTEREISELKLLQEIIKKRFDIKDLRRRRGNHKGKHVYVGLAKELLNHNFVNIAYAGDMGYESVRKSYATYLDLSFIPANITVINSLIKQFEDEKWNLK